MVSIAERRSAWWAHRPSYSTLRPPATDAALVLVLVLASLGQLDHHFGASEARVVLVLALSLPLAWRRRAPRVVFGIVAAVALGQWFAGPPVLADFALLWAFYTVATSCSTRHTVIAGAILELGVVLAVARYGGSVRTHAFGLLFLSGLVTAAGVLGANLRIRRAYLAAVEQRAAQLESERDQQSQLAVASERTRIAREMHDVIAHNLTVMIALTDGAALTVQRDPARAGRAIAEASLAGRSALHEMRRVLGVLRDSDESFSLSPTPGLAALDALLENVRRTGLDVRFESHGRLDGLGAGLELTIYRLVQEALTNTVKHAAAPTRIVVRLLRDGDQVCVSVTDDGGPPAQPGHGHGLVGMRERVAVHAGSVQAGPTPNGWQVSAALPVTSLTEP